MKLDRELPGPLVAHYRLSLAQDCGYASRGLGPFQALIDTLRLTGSSHYLHKAEKVFLQLRNHPFRSPLARAIARWYLDLGPFGDAGKALYYASKAEESAESSGDTIQSLLLVVACSIRLGRDIDFHLIISPLTSKRIFSPDILFAIASARSHYKHKLRLINQALSYFNSTPITLLDDPGLAAFDLLSAAPHAVIHGPKVSVIISTHNSSGRLTAALRSLQNQTWRNCEFIIVDDASPGFDDKDIAETFARDDNRFIYMRMPYNGGAYVARNEALKHVSGEFVTLHDSDDWSHPQKIETQARFMLSNPSVIGCTSEQIRCTSDLVFDEIRSNEYLVFFNTSSFLWRRSVVIKALGCWDAVRFGADSEFIRRVQSVFGINSVVHMNTGPLSFQRRHNSSVTSGELTGLETLYSGARKEYAESSAYYLLNYHIPHYSDDISVCRQFPVPTMMLPSHGLDSGNLAFDIVIYGDVYQGSEYMENVLGIIMDDKLANYTMALIPVVSDGRVPPSIEIVADVRRLSHLGYVFIAVYGERIIASRIIYASPLPQELLFVADVAKG